MRSLFASERYRELAFVGFWVGCLVVLALSAEAAIRLGINGIVRHQIENAGEQEEAEYSELWRDGGAFVPGISFFRMRSNSTFGNIRLNNLGLRGPDVEEPKPQGRIRIAVLGNSTVLGLELNEAETIPAQLVTFLSRRNPACSFDYVSVAGPEYKLPDFLWLIENALDSASLDHVVIVHTGARKRVKRKFYERFMLYGKLWKPLRQETNAEDREKNVPEPLQKALIAEKKGPLDQILQTVDGAGIWYHSFYGRDHARLEGLRTLWQDAVMDSLSSHEGAVFEDGLQSIPANSEFFLSHAHYTPAGAEMAARLIADSFFEAYPEQNALCE